MIFKFDSTAIYSVECENGDSEVVVRYQSDPGKPYTFETGDSFIIESFCGENNIYAEGTEKKSIGKQIAQWKKDGILTPALMGHS